MSTGEESARVELFRGRAAELRVTAAAMKIDAARQALLSLADSYEKTALELEAKIPSDAIEPDRATDAAPPP